MIRRFLTPRWIVLHLMTIAIVVLFCFFGRWQLHRWEGRGTTVIPPDKRPATALGTIESPDQPLPGDAIGRQATASGRYDAAHQVLVPNRTLGNRNGYWVVTPLRSGASPAAAMVVRGWVASPTDPGLGAPATPVTVTGRLFASEDPAPIGDGSNAALPTGQVREVNTAELTTTFPYRILDGYLLLQSETPPSAAGSTPAVLPLPVRTENQGGGIRNLAYALQWWMFVAAVIYFWGKLIREDLTDPEEQAEQVARPTSGPAPGEPAPAPASPRVPDEAALPLDEDWDPHEDAELAAYNRYLADLNARGGRSSRTAR